MNALIVKVAWFAIGGLWFSVILLLFVARACGFNGTMQLYPLVIAWPLILVAGMVAMVIGIPISKAVAVKNDELATRRNPFTAAAISFVVMMLVAGGFLWFSHGHPGSGAL